MVRQRGAKLDGPIGGDGLNLDALAGEVHVQGNEFAQIGGSGVNAAGGAGSWTIDDNVLMGPINSEGISIRNFHGSGEGSFIRENTLTGVGRVGVLLSDSVGSWSIDDNVLRGTGERGIRVMMHDGFEAVNVRDNLVEGGRLAGIELCFVQAPISVLGNTVESIEPFGPVGPGETAQMGVGIAAIDSGEGFVSGNTLRANSLAGVLVDLANWQARVNVLTVQDNIYEGHAAGRELVMVGAATQRLTNISNDPSQGVPAAAEEGGNDELTATWAVDREATPPASCGDGVLQTGELCDDGDVNNDDDCDNSCRPGRR